MDYNSTLFFLFWKNLTHLFMDVIKRIRIIYISCLGTASAKSIKKEGICLDIVDLYSLRFPLKVSVVSISLKAFTHKISPLTNVKAQIILLSHFPTSIENCRPNGTFRVYIFCVFPLSFLVL